MFLGCDGELFKKQTLLELLVGNATVRTRKLEHITPVLASLHWLPLHFQILKCYCLL